MMMMMMMMIFERLSGRNLYMNVGFLFLDVGNGSPLLPIRNGHVILKNGENSTTFDQLLQKQEQVTLQV